MNLAQVGLAAATPDVVPVSEPLRGLPRADVTPFAFSADVSPTRALRDAISALSSPSSWATSAGHGVAEGSCAKDGLAAAAQPLGGARYVVLAALRRGDGPTAELIARSITRLPAPTGLKRPDAGEDPTERGSDGTPERAPRAELCKRSTDGHALERGRTHGQRAHRYHTACIRAARMGGWLAGKSCRSSDQ